MKYELKSTNDISLFHSLDQWDEKITKMMCTFYSPVINMKYNCWIVMTEDDIKIIAKRQADKGMFSYTEWGKWLDWIEAVYNYVVENSRERGWKIPNLAIFRKEDEAELLKWYDRGYASVIGIKVSREFYKDARDWVIDIKDYAGLKGKIGHFTNITKWIGRWDPEVMDYGTELFIDSYIR